MHNHNNDDDNRNGGQKGSLLDWLLAFFLIRKSNQKAKIDDQKSPEKTESKTTIIKPEDEVVTKEVTNDNINTLNASNENDDAQLSNSIDIPDKTNKKVIEAFVAIDNLLKSEEPEKDKVSKLIDDVSKLIKKQLNKSREELDKVDTKIGTAIKKEDIERLQKELNDVYNKIVLLRDRVESLRKGKFGDYNLEEDQKIIIKVKELSNYATRDEILNIMHLCDAKLITVLDFLKTESKKEVVSEDLNAKGNLVVSRDNHFDKSKSKFKLVKDAESILKMSIKEQDQEIKRLQEEIKALEPSIRVVTHMKGFTNIFSNTLKIAFGIMSLPLSGTKSKLFGTMLIGNSIKGLKKGLSFTDEQIVYYEYSKFNHTISSTISRLDGIDYMLKNALTDLKDLKVDYIYHFREYQNVIPEYADFIKKIESLETKLVSEREKIEKMTQKVNAQRKNDKVLRKVIAGQI